MGQVRTFVLLVGLTLILVWLGGIFGGRIGATTAFIFALLMNFIVYYNSDRLILSMYRAKELEEDEFPWLHAIVKELSERMGIPTPKVFVIPQPSPNAFATGRSPEHSSIAVTDGLLKLLTREEIKGVLGHELSHIKHRDTLIQTIAASIAGAISMLAFWMRWGAIFGGDDENGVPPLLLLLLSILAPLSAVIIQMSISRNREYMADTGGAKVSGNPLYLANALRKLESYKEYYPLESNPATSPLFIVHPFSGKNLLSSLFSTHPPTEERIRRLESMALQEGGKT